MSRKGKKELPQAVRGAIIVLRNQGKTYRQIAQILSVSVSAAHQTVIRAQKYGTTTSLPRSGRPHKLSPHTRRIILRLLRAFRFESYKSIAKRMGTVTARQVKYVANQANYHRRVARRKPFLNRQMAIKRLEWARMNRFRNWEQLVWTDEVVCDTGEHPDCILVTRMPGEAYVRKK
jgi:transposase